MGDQPVLTLTDDARRFEISLSALDAAPVGMVVTDADGTVLWSNASFAALIGLPRPLDGRRLDDLVTADRPGDADERLRAVLAGEAVAYEAEERWLLHSGEERAVVVSAALAAGASGGSNVVIQTLDTTDRRRAEHELQRSNEELTQFAYVASHDLSEPLRVIAGHVELLAQRYDDQLDDTAREWITFAVDGCARMRSLIDDLLAYSRAGREIALADVDLGPLVEQVAIGYGDAVQIGPLPVVRGDYRLLQQTFANLLSNAVKFARRDVPPQVSVTAERVDHDWVVTVADNGIGIEPKYRDRVFRIFQRLHGRSEYPGTGIGLAIVRKAAEQLGGRVEVTDSPLGGAAVRLTLPVREGAIDG